MKTITLYESHYDDLLDAANVDSFENLIHKLWQMELDYIGVCEVIQTGSYIERRENEDPAEVLETLRETYKLSVREITSRLWDIRTISDLLRGIAPVVRCIKRQIKEQDQNAATPQPAPVSVNSEALERIGMLTAMVKDLHAEQMHTDRLLARCRALLKERGINEEEITVQAE